MQPVTHTLPNGLRIIHLHDDSDVVYCGYAIHAGTRHEAPGEEGLAHFCEHMTFKGTSRLSSMKIINALERVGGELNAYTAKEETVYYAAILRQHFNRAVELLTEIVFHSTYPEAELEKEREVVCDEIESYRDSPAELIYDDFENVVFSAYNITSLAHNVLGTEDTVRSFTPDHCRRFTQRWYTPARAVFYVMGNINFQRLIKRLETITPADTTIITPEVCTYTAVHDPEAITKPVILHRDTHQAHVMTGAAITSDINRWHLPLFLANNILGGPGMNSRLNISLRERRGLVYTVESLMTTYTDTLLWTTYYGCDHADTSRCRRLVASELQRLRRAPLSPATLTAAKQQIKGQIALASQNRENYAIDMAKQFLHYGKIKNLQRLFTNIDKVTAGDIHELMTTVLAEDRLFTLIYQ